MKTKERPNMSDFLPKEITLKEVHELFSKSPELYKYIIALENYIDCLENSNKVEDIKPTLKVHSYIENGIKYEYEVDENGLRNGFYKLYYENGQLWVDAFYKDDKLNGFYKSYFNNGQLCIDTVYKNGERNGFYKLYYKNGQLCIDTTYINDEQSGSCKEYNDNGQLWFEAFYKNGKEVK